MCLIYVSILLIVQGALAVTLCKEGYGLTQANSSTCSPCTPGTFSPANSALCVNCPAMTSSVAQSKSSNDCKPCPASFVSVAGGTCHGRDDYMNLYKALIPIVKNGQLSIPKLIRMSFHDLLNQKCQMLKCTIQSFHLYIFFFHVQHSSPTFPTSSVTWTSAKRK